MKLSNLSSEDTVYGYIHEVWGGCRGLEEVNYYLSLDPLSDQEWLGIVKELESCAKHEPYASARPVWNETWPTRAHYEIDLAKWERDRRAFLDECLLVAELRRNEILDGHRLAHVNTLPFNRENPEGFHFCEVKSDTGCRCCSSKSLEVTSSFAQSWSVITLGQLGRFAPVALYQPGDVAAGTLSQASASFEMRKAAHFEKYHAPFVGYSPPSKEELSLMGFVEYEAAKARKAQYDKLRWHTWKDSDQAYDIFAEFGIHLVNDYQPKEEDD